MHTVSGYRTPRARMSLSLNEIVMLENIFLRLFQFLCHFSGCLFSDKSISKINFKAILRAAFSSRSAIFFQWGKKKNISQNWEIRYTFSNRSHHCPKALIFFFQISVYSRDSSLRHIARQIAKVGNNDGTPRKCSIH